LLSAHPNEMASQLKQDQSMTYNEGSVVFLVGGTVFKIPKAILEINSEVFSGTGLISGTEPIVLEDPPEVFEEFCKIMHLPFESCLAQPDPDLIKVLQICQIANKYCAQSIEARANRVARFLTRPDTIRNILGPNLSAIQIVETASRAACHDVADVAWDVVIEDHTKGETSSSDLLALARTVDRPEYWGKAYYKIMVKGSEHWENDPEIVVEDRRALHRGFTKCVEASQLLAKAWIRRVPETKHNRLHNWGKIKNPACAKAWFQHAWGAYTLKNSYCDVFGLLEWLATDDLVPDLSEHCRAALFEYASIQNESRPSWEEMAGCFVGTPPDWSRMLEVEQAYDPKRLYPE